MKFATIYRWILQTRKSYENKNKKAKYAPNIGYNDTTQLESAMIFANKSLAKDYDLYDEYKVIKIRIDIYKLDK